VTNGTLGYREAPQSELHTLETHRWRIMEKMTLHSMAEPVPSALRRGLVSGRLNSVQNLSYSLLVESALYCGVKVEEEK
jgi:hypothetical protein